MPILYPEGRGEEESEEDYKARLTQWHKEFVEKIKKQEELAKDQQETAESILDVTRVEIGNLKSEKERLDEEREILEQHLKALRDVIAKGGKTPPVPPVPGPLPPPHLTPDMDQEARLEAFMKVQQQYHTQMQTLLGSKDLGVDLEALTPEQRVTIKLAEQMAQVVSGLSSQTETVNMLKDTIRGMSTTMGDATLGGPLDKREKLLRYRKIPPPIFKGVPGERPEAHLLRASDWMGAVGISKEDKDLQIENFRYTLDGLAREWYDQYDKVTLGNNYEKLIDDFSRYFSCQGRSMKHLHDRWKSFEFKPEVDDIEEFIRNVQETGNQLNYDDHAVLNMIKSCMPTAIYSTLYDVTNLQKCITMVKDIYARNPAEVHRQAQAAAAAVHTGTTPVVPGPPFSSLQSVGKVDLNQLAEAFNALEIQNKPYKPQLAPRGGRGRGRGNGRGGRPRPFEFSGRGRAYFSNGWNNGTGQSSGNRGGFPGRGRSPNKNNRGGRGRGMSRGGGQSFDKNPPKNKPKMKQPKIDEDRCHKCKQIGHWARECPVKDEPTASGFGALEETFYQCKDNDYKMIDVYRAMQDDIEEDDALADLNI